MQYAHCVDSKVKQLSTYFSKCPFTSRFWSIILQKCVINRAGLSWRRDVSWFTRNATGKSGLSTCRRVACNATIYHLQMERNRVVFKRDAADVNRVVSKVVSCIKLRLQSAFNSIIGPSGVVIKSWIWVLMSADVLCCRIAVVTSQVVF